MCFSEEIFSDARRAPHFVLLLLRLLAAAHLDRDNLNAGTGNGILNVPSIIEKSDKQADLHLNTQGQ